MTDFEAAEPGVIRFERSMTIDENFASRLTAASIRHVTPKISRMLLVVALALVSLSVFFAAKANNWGAVAALVATFGGLLAIFFALFMVSFQTSRKQVSAQLPVGTEYSLNLYDDSLRIAVPHGASDLSYDLYTSVLAKKDVVVFTAKVGREPTFLPRELFTEESLAWLSQKIKSA